MVASPTGDESLRVCWIQHGAEYAWAPDIADRLGTHGITTSFVATLRVGLDAYRSTPHAAHFISGDAFDESVEIDETDLERIDAMYGPPTVRSVADGDVHLHLLYKRDEAKRLAVVARAILWWERFIDEQKPDAFLVRETSAFATRTAFLVGRRRGVPTLKIDVGPSDDWFNLNDVGEHSCSSFLLEILAAGPRALAPEEDVMVDALVRSRAKAGVGNIRPGDRPLPLLPAYLGREVLRERRARRAGDPIQIAAHRLTRWVMTRRTVARLTRRVFPYQQPQGPYVFFPMFFSGEGWILSQHHYWAERILDIASEVARALPAGYELVVKEHPQVPGDRSPADLLRLRRMPRVRVVDPTVPSAHLLRDASAVFVAGGTAGWEAFLNRIPVVTFLAEPWYARSELVWKVSDVGQLQYVLMEALQAGGSKYDDRVDEWRWFIHATMAASLPGTFFKFEGPPYFDDANLLQVADSMAMRIRQLFPTGGASSVVASAESA